MCPRISFIETAALPFDRLQARSGTPTRSRFPAELDPGFDNGPPVFLFRSDWRPVSSKNNRQRDPRAEKDEAVDPKVS
jgi:hypothetical protein